MVYLEDEKGPSMRALASQTAAYAAPKAFLAKPYFDSQCRPDW